ncbi:hypothetical protein SH528x_002033 [Novipirellula sp. SH528]|uniref:hypothetical protein n=1 Tax=Novipirellula sp. SH528 TaxID=3454466 RepID=UPI003FA0964F
MCCFSRPVESVADTRIFARAAGKGWQFIVYSMSFEATEDLAMILPLPSRENLGEDAVEFINLEQYPKFFDDMHAGFPKPAPSGKAGGFGALAIDSELPLKVVDVGSFEASFVPTIGDFDRLDARFKLDAETWDAIPKYKSYGFAVFKLKKGDHKVHPMAFKFASAIGWRLFFPTVHIHDGKVHREADFDHELYCQLSDVDARHARNWTESTQPAGMFLDKEKLGELIDPDEHCYQRVMKGSLRNIDVLVG